MKKLLWQVFEKNSATFYFSIWPHFLWKNLIRVYDCKLRLWSPHFPYLKNQSNFTTNKCGK